MNVSFSVYQRRIWLINWAELNLFDVFNVCRRRKSSPTAATDVTVKSGEEESVGQLLKEESGPTDAVATVELQEAPVVLQVTETLETTVIPLNKVRLLTRDL